MKTVQLIIIGVGIPVAGIMIGVYFPSIDSTHYDLEIQGMKEEYQIGEQYSFYYHVSGYGNTCGRWVVSFPDKNGVIQYSGETVDCTQLVNKNLDYDSRTSNRKFSSFVPQIPGQYNVTVSIENTEPVVYKFVVLPEMKQVDDGRRFQHGFTPSFEYHRVQINGTTATAICGILGVSCTSNPVFDAINRHDKNYTYFYYELPDKEFLFVVDDKEVCYTTDDVGFEYTGLLEKCVRVGNED